MVFRARLLVTLAMVAAFLVSCRPYRAPAAIDAEVASSVPPDAVAIAGLNLDQLRSTSLYRSRAQRDEAFREASYLLIASNGKDLLLIARGQFRETPPGATRLTPTLVVAGTPDYVSRAKAQHQTGATGARRLFGLAADIAGAKPVWIVAEGGINLPLSGNAINLNRILHFTDHVTLTAQIGSQVEIEAAGVCRSPEPARQLEESLRAFLTLAGEAGGQSVFQSASIRREEQTVRASLSVSLQTAEQWLHAAIP